MKAFTAISAVGLFCAGAGIGAATALMYAPQSGKRTRRDLRKFANEKLDRVEDFRGEMVTRASDRIDDAKKGMNDYLDATRKAIDVRWESAAHVLDDFRKRIGAPS